MKRLYLAAALVTVLSSCSSPAPVSDSATQGSTVAGSSVFETQTQPDIADNETMDARAQTLSAMLQRAQTDRAAGRFPSAEATLETALRIAPNDARLWLELAEVRLAAADYPAAQANAERATSLAGTNYGIIEAAQRIHALAAQYARQ